MKTNRALLLGPALLAAAIAAQPAGAADHKISGQTRRAIVQTTDESGVLTQVYTLEAEGLIKDQDTGETEPIHATVTVRFQTQGSSLLSAVVEYTRHTGDRVSITEAIGPCGLALTNDPLFTAENFASDALGGIQKRLEVDGDKVITPCGVHVISEFLTEAASHWALPFAKSGGLQ